MRRLPRAEVIPGLNRQMVTRADGSMLNTCSSDVLVEMLRFLKRAYWPFPWQSTPDNATGGFHSAATVPCSHPPPHTCGGVQVYMYQTINLQATPKVILWGWPAAY
jgi:hypothetical protein